MPRELIALAPRTPTFRVYKEPPLGPRDVRIRSEFAAPKHGTELLLYRGMERILRTRYDDEWGCLLPRSDTQVRHRFPRRLGNMAVGVVVEAGEAVTRFQPGDRVFGHLPIRETHTVDERRVFRMPPGLSDEAAVCLDPAVMALALRDATIRLGDRVAIFGLGAIGLMAVQLARQAGAYQVIAIEPIETRRELGLRYGADVAIAPDADTGLAVRELTRGLPGTRLERPVRHREYVLGGYRNEATQWSNLGVDVAIEVSGSTRALHDAIRATRFGGTVCVLSYYSGEALGLYLGEEFHHNRLQLISCRTESLPLRDAPGWSLERMVRTALDWLASGRLRVDGMVHPIVPFDQADEAYRMIDQQPDSAIKLGVRFSFQT